MQNWTSEGKYIFLKTLKIVYYNINGVICGINRKKRKIYQEL